MALAFATSSDYLSRVSDLLNYNATYTVAFWVKFNALTTFDTILCFTDGTSSYRDMLLLDTTTGNKLALRINNGTQLTTTGTTVLSTGTWYHVAVVRSAAALITVYLNGVSEVTNTKDVTGRTAISDMRVALDQGGTNAGNIETAYMKAFSAALSTDQIASERWAARPIYPSSLYAFWPMVAGAARSNDFSGAGRSWSENGSVSSTDGPAPVIWGGELPPAVTAATVAPSIPTEPYGTWSVFVDWDGDGDFDATGEDISDLVRDAHWKLGMSKPFQSLADKTECKLTVRNHDGRFTPENVSSPLYNLMLPGRLMEIRCTFYGVTRTHWRGFLESVQTFGATKRQPDAEIRGTDLKGFAQQTKVSIPLLEDVTADTALRRLFLGIYPPPGTWTGSWILGIAGFSELGETTYLADEANFFDFESGLITFPYVGDRWEDGVDVYRAALDVVAAERGRFFTSRDGKLTFWNWQHLPLNITVDATIDNDMADMKYVFGDDIVNAVKVTTTPRKVTADSILWTLDEETTVRVGESKVIRASFKDDSGADLGGRDLVTPNLGDGSLVVTGSVSLAVEAKARNAEITATNTGTVDATITTMILKGTKLSSFSKREIVVRNEDSINLYGERWDEINTDLLSSEEHAQRIAGYELARRGTARGIAYSVTLQNRSVTLYNTALALTIGSRIRVIEDVLHHDSEYMVIGEDHTLSDGTKKHMMTLYTEVADGAAVWILGVAGYSELGETTILGI